MFANEFLEIGPVLPVSKQLAHLPLLWARIAPAKAIFSLRLVNSQDQVQKQINLTLRINLLKSISMRDGKSTLRRSRRKRNYRPIIQSLMWNKQWLGSRLRASILVWLWSDALELVVKVMLNLSWCRYSTRHTNVQVSRLRWKKSNLSLPTGICSRETRLELWLIKTKSTYFDFGATNTRKRS